MNIAVEIIVALYSTGGIIVMFYVCKVMRGENFGPLAILGTGLVWPIPAFVVLRDKLKGTK